MEFSGHFFATGDGLKLYYRDFAAPSGGRLPVVCLHGLTRNGEDFEDVAAHIQPARRVLTLDFPGRGRSEYAPDYRRYHPDNYAVDVVQWLDSLGLERVVMFGTSLGGLVTMLIARDHPQRIGAAILNDIGPVVSPEGLARISSYVGKLPEAETWEQAVANCRMMFAHAWPDLDEETWRLVARRTYELDPDGRPRLRSDPLIGRALFEVGGGAPADPWALFGALADIPTLSLRGEFSDILSAETVAAMIQRKPDLQAVSVKGRGHVPLLDEPDALAAIDRFLDSVP